MIVETKGLRVDLGHAVFKKSTRSGGNSDNCVEVAFINNAIAVRDSKNPTAGTLLYTRAEWDAFIGGVKNGEFDQ